MTTLTRSVSADRHRFSGCHSQNVRKSGSFLRKADLIAPCRRRLRVNHNKQKMVTAVVPWAHSDCLLSRGLRPLFSLARRMTEPKLFDRSFLLSLIDFQLGFSHKFC
jgi:hypothetical protein